MSFHFLFKASAARLGIMSESAGKLRSAIHVSELWTNLPAYQRVHPHHTWGWSTHSMKTGACTPPKFLGVWIHKPADDQALLRFHDDLAVESYRNAQHKKWPRNFSVKTQEVYGELLLCELDRLCRLRHARLKQGDCSNYIKLQKMWSSCFEAFVNL